MNEIKRYLENSEKDFEQGYALFQKYATIAMKEKYSAYIERTKAQNMLIGRLKFLIYAGLVNNGASAQEKQVPTAMRMMHPMRPTKKINENKPEPDPNAIPDHLKDAYAKIKEAQAPMASLHEQIQNPSLDNETRKETANQLCMMEDNLQAEWNKIDEYKKNATKEQKEKLDQPKKILTTEQLVIQKVRLQKNLQRTQNQLNKGDYKSDVTKSNAIKNIERMKKEIENIEKELSERKN